MRLTINASLELQAAPSGVVTVWLDSPGRSVNILDEQMLQGLEAALEHMASQPSYRLLVFRSRKLECFFAGADVHAMAELRDPQQIGAIIDRGQMLLQRVAELQQPSLAVVEGACLGGGLELALACTYRAAIDSPNTKLSLPEIRLGLIPGWGGTQRLTQRVGTQHALNMILSGSSVNAQRARQIGLVDFVLPATSDEQPLANLLQQLLSGSAQGGHRSSSWSQRLLDGTSLGRYCLRRMAQHRLASQTSHYPALPAALEAIRLASNDSRRGYRYEREAFSQLLFTPTAQSLLATFTARDRARKPSTWLSSNDTPQPKLTSTAQQRLAVIGAGAMGVGIGLAAARRGITVVFKEINATAAEAGLMRVRTWLSDQVSARRLSLSESRAIEGRCTATSDWAELAPCDLAIEAALEVDSVKRDIFQQLDRWLPASAVLVTNTSSLNVTHMALATRRKNQVAGLHFFNPVDRMDLVEVVRTEMTDERTLVSLLELVRRLGKTPIVTADKPGFLVNRILFPYLGEAVRMVAEGWSITDIDRQLRRFGMPLGPLQLIDQVGVDIASHVAGALAKIQADAELPASLLRTMTERGWLGKKSGTGFYRWSKRPRPNLALGGSVTSALPRPASTDDGFAPDGLTSIERRLVYPMLNEAVHCLDEMVVSDAWIVDLGMTLGIGFAPHLGGPLRFIDSLGSELVCSNMSRLAQQLGNRFAPADGLVARGARRQQFFSDRRVIIPQTWESHHEFGCTTD